MHQVPPHPAPPPPRLHPCRLCAACVQALSGDKGFLTKARLSRYAEKRNDPTIPNALSGLSPYLHFGHLSAQRAAIEAAKNKAVHKVGNWRRQHRRCCWCRWGVARRMGGLSASATWSI